MAQSKAEIAQALLEEMVKKQVSKALGTVSNELASCIKSENIAESEEPDAARLLLEMVRRSCSDFCDKMEKRIEKKAKDNKSE